MASLTLKLKHLNNPYKQVHRLKRLLRNKNIMFEDDLPKGMPKAEYDAWYVMSWVDGVRMGPVPPCVRSE